MKNYVLDLRQLSLKIIDCQQAIISLIEPQLTEDIFKYNLEKNNKLLRQFIVYRLCSFFLQCVEAGRTGKTKILFLLSPKITTKHLTSNNLFIYNTIKKIALVLALKIYNSQITLEKIFSILESHTGESRELKNILFGNLSKDRMPSIKSFNSLLEKYKIHKLQGDISQGYNIKLGLFIA